MGLFSSKKKKEEKEDLVVVEPSTTVVSIGTYGIVLSPHVTEKGSALASVGKYVFKVFRGANKTEIKGAVHNLYNVDVTNVNIVNIPPKKRRVGNHMGTKSGFKKAIITLKHGQSIDLTK